jgi:hypothetical protein
MPMLIETEKSHRREGAQLVIDPFDEMNLQTLRGLLRIRSRPGG